ncbi:MAG: site-specific integrase, partial [Christensenellaceae bacterium]|nr:site-specific integrase [Christensenellaceae bacterium]
PREAEYQASAYLTSRSAKLPEEMTLDEAISEFIQIRSHVLSPSTIVGYKRLQHLFFSDIRRMTIRHLVSHQGLIQGSLNRSARTYSPKTIRNAFGLLSGVFRQYAKGYALDISLPQAKKVEMKIPSREEALQLISEARSQDLRLAIIIATAMGLRRSELCALQWERDIDMEHKRLHVQEALVLGDDKQWHIKAPKSAAGHRTLAMPDVVHAALSAIEPKEGLLIHRKPDGISNAFTALKKRLGLGVRFHDLRHYYASLLLALGVPDKYAMERMGHGTDHMLKAVYQHTMQEKEREVDELINASISHDISHTVKETG